MKAVRVKLGLCILLFLSPLAQAQSTVDLELQVDAWINVGEAHLGQVTVTQGGQPVPSARVEFSGLSLPYVTTNSDGEAHFSIASTTPAGTYSLQAFVTKVGQDEATSNAASATLRVTAVDITFTASAGPHTVGTTVTATLEARYRHDGSAVAGQPLLITGDFSQTVTTASDGKATFQMHRDTASTATLGALIEEADRPNGIGSVALGTPWRVEWVEGSGGTGGGSGGSGGGSDGTGGGSGGSSGGSGEPGDDGTNDGDTSGGSNGSTTGGDPDEGTPDANSGSGTNQEDETVDEDASGDAADPGDDASASSGEGGSPGPRGAPTISSAFLFLILFALTLFRRNPQ